MIRFFMRGRAVMLVQQIKPEISFKIPPDRMDVIGVIMRVVVSDEKAFSLSLTTFWNTLQNNWSLLTDVKWHLLRFLLHHILVEDDFLEKSKYRAKFAAPKINWFIQSK